MLDSFLDNVSFRYIKGDLTPVCHPQSTHWRQLPCWVIVVPVGAAVELETRQHGRMSCKAGCAAIIPPNLEHCFRTYPNADYVSYWSHVVFPLPGGMDAADFLDTPLLAGPRVGKRLARINRELAHLKPDDSTTPLMTAGRYLELGFTLLTTICSVSREKNMLNPRSPHTDAIRQLLVRIERHLHEPLGRDQLARWCGLSPARFHVVFQQVVGLSPIQFIKQQRMKKAQFLLSETNQSIKQIGDSVGYADPYTFSRAFKITIGVSPRTYRNRASHLFIPGV